MKKRRKNYQAEEKVAIIKRHLVDGECVSSICESLKLQPSQFYSWQNSFLRMERALLSRQKRKHPARHQSKSRLSSWNRN